jgi:hypothetical protein
VELERILVAHWSNRTEDEFDALERDDKAYLIAAYRTVNQIEAVAMYAASQPKPSGRLHVTQPFTPD